MIARRVVWLAAGAAAGMYATAKARRAAHRLSVPGLVDQAAALGVGWRELRSEIETGMTVHEQRLEQQLTSTLHPQIEQDTE